MTTYPITVLVPDNLSDYSGPAPVTFGVQLPKGELPNAENIRLTHGSRYKRASFRTTAQWDPPYVANSSVRWLLVDTVVDIDNGVPEVLQLTYGPSVPPEPSYGHLDLLQNGTSVPLLPIALPLQQRGLSLLLAHIKQEFENLIGHFEIEAAGQIYTFSIHQGEEEWEVVTAVRCTAKLVGQYISPRDSKPIAQATLRLIFWHNMAAIQIFHTLTWLREDLREIDALKLSRQVTTAPMCSAEGNSFTLSSTIRQVSFDSTNNPIYNYIDGWIHTTENPPCHISLRWAREEYPTSFSYDAVNQKVSIGLIDPEGTMSLDPTTPPLASKVSTQPSPSKWEGYGIVPGAPNDWPWTSRGLSKTHELWFIWGQDALASSTLHRLVNEQVYAILEPASAPKADLPSPWSAASSEFPDLEAAIKASFDFLTQQQDEYDDFGVWNHGDLQTRYMDWLQPPYETTYRYWLNYGKGWSPVPWLLWLRSADRKYIDNAIKYSRHLMDVDTCHIPETYQTKQDWNLMSTDHKVRGGVYTYSNTHIPHLTQAGNFYCDPAEHLALCWYLTGYERALEVLQTTMLSFSQEPTRSFIWDTLSGAVAQPVGITRTQYNLIRELALLYECSCGSLSQLGSQSSYLFQLLVLFMNTVAAGVVSLQKSNGVWWFPGVHLAHYLSQSLLVARRVLGDSYAYFDGTEGLTILEILKRWYRYLGDIDDLGSDGRCDGPESLWVLVELYRATGDQSYLETAARIAMTRALCVATNGQGEMHGVCGYEAQDAGPVLRDAVAVIAALESLPPASRPTGLAASTYFHSVLPAPDPPFTLRHVIFFKRDKPEEVKLCLHLTPYNFGAPKSVRVLVHEPVGGSYVTHQVDRIVTPTYDKTWSNTEVFTIPLPSNGDLGLCAVQVFQDGDAWIPVHARAFYLAVKPGGGELPLVHWMPDIPHSGKVVRNNSYGGQFFAVADNSGHITVDPTYSIGGRVILLQNGTIIATTQVAGSLGTHALTAIEADVVPESVIAIAYGDIRREAALTVQGVLPYYSGWEELLFIPNIPPSLASILKLTP